MHAFSVVKQYYLGGDGVVKSGVCSGGDKQQCQQQLQL